MFITPADVLLHTYSDNFLGGGGVLFALDKKRKIPFSTYYTSVKTEDRPDRDQNNKYWCLSRYMHLLGKQMAYCKTEKSQEKKCYSDAKGIENVKIGENRLSGNLALTFGNASNGGKRRRSKRMNKKYRSNKNVHKKIKRKTYKHRKTKKC
jgi:site-specific DNA-adenine methylase